MKIIRRKRTIKIETCAFRQWQSEGTESSFSCPNCGKTFETNPELNAAIEKLLPELVEEEITNVRALPEARDLEGSCDEGCAEKL